MEEVRNRVARRRVRNGGRAQQDEEYRRDQRESPRIAPELEAARRRNGLHADAPANTARQVRRRRGRIARPQIPERPPPPDARDPPRVSPPALPPPAGCRC